MGKRTVMPCYSKACLVGNWSEERKIDDDMTAEFLVKATTGSLQLDRLQARTGVALQPVELSRICDDQWVHFGDMLQLRHVETSSVLACDVEAKDARRGEQACRATAAPSSAPVARNTLLLTKWQPALPSALDDDWPGDTLHYGQKIQLVSNPVAQGEEPDCAGGPRPLCLFSRPVTTTHCARYSRNQLVGWTWRAGTYNTAWEVRPPNPVDAAISTGGSVPAGQPILLVHCATQAPLCLEQLPVPTDFGCEMEVSANLAVNASLQLVLEYMAKGEMVRALPKQCRSPNMWKFISGATVAVLPQRCRLTEDGDAALSQLAQDLLTAPGGLAVLARKLELLQDACGGVDPEELQLALRQAGARMADAELGVLARRFRATGATRGDAQALLHALQLHVQELARGP